ncbi:MAG: hypothetical protein M3R36_16835 [Bacteroidota bacterium]|nr:hypothetical protein [Bacteroidota bacterium]
MIKKKILNTINTESLDFKKFTDKVVLLSSIILALSFSLIFIFDLKIYIAPLIFGWLLSFLNVMAGGLVVTRSVRQKGTGFINKVLLSLVVRVFAITLLLLFLIYVLKIEKISLAISFFFFYIIFLILEINYISGSTDKK